jgi:hypothetical protein
LPALLAAAFLLVYSLAAAWIVAGDRRPLPEFNATLQDNGSLSVEGAVPERTLRDELLGQLADEGEFDIIVSDVRVDPEAGEIDSIGDLVDGLLSQIAPEGS